MRIIKFLVALAITVGLVYLCNNPFKYEGLPAPVPPLGKLINPFTGFWQNADQLENFKNVNLQLPGLKDKVNVHYDERMVPHIFAQNEHDLMMVQGYVIAENRLWQMDFLTRFASGRLSEVMGERTIEIDKVQRRRGLLFAAEKAVEGWANSPEEFKLLEAYVAGVNSYVNQLKPADYPIEFKILNYEPEEWSPVKTALISKYMSQTLAGRENDLEASNALKKFGQTAFEFLYPEWNPKQMPIIPAGTPFEFGDSLSTEPIPAEEIPETEMIGYYKHTPLEKPSKFLGSNNWAVAAGKTKNGNPILCSDPHLRLTLPSIWYEIQLQTPELNSYGVSIPGLPYVIIGFNENIAWGQTNVGHDVFDWYQIQWADDEKKTYYLDGEVREVNPIVEVIRVNGYEDPILDTVKYTYWGPIVYESDTLPHHDLAARWIAHDAPEHYELGVFPGLNKGKNYDDYSKALAGYETPAQNFVFASTEGDIAIKVNGKFPIKKKGQGRFVQDGSSTENAWQGYVPMDQVPQIKNPASGYVGSANQHSTAPDYPYYYNAGFDDYRGRYVFRRLGQLNNISMEDMMAMQNDNFSILAEELTPLLLKHLDTTNLSSVQKRVVKNLRDWDYRFEKDAVAPIFFDEWSDAFYEMTWDEVYSLRDSMPILYPETWRTVALLDEDPESGFFNDKSTLEKETATEIVTRSFEKVVADLDEKLVDLNYNWSKHKATNIQHLGQIPSFSRKVDSGGYGQALNATRRFAGPSWRMVVELGDEITAYGIFPGGQSGNPGSKFYDYSVEKWSKGEYHELFFMKDESDDRQKITHKQEFWSE